MSSLINFKNVFFSYNKNNIILNNISLDINHGELISIIGPNGSGKSTLVKQFNGILTPDSGTVNALGYLTTDLENILNIRKNIAMVFQNPENQIVATIVEEDVAFALENLGVDPNEIRRKVDSSLELVGMIQYKQHATYQLSGGQKQRIAIASAIAMKPKCIVFDEATSMLDPNGRKNIMDLVIKLSKELGICIIYVTHFMEEACLANRLIVMNQGKIEIDSSPVKVFSDPNRLKSIGLELPVPTELCRKLQDQGYQITTPVMTINDATKALENVLESDTNITKTVKLTGGLDQLVNN